MKQILWIIVVITFSYIQSMAQAPLVFKGFDLNNGVGPSIPVDFVECNGKLFFVALTATAGNELWVTDGTVTGTKMVKDINPGTGSSILPIANKRMVAFGTKVFFSASDGVSGTELWVSDGTTAGTVMLKDINVGTVASNPMENGIGEIVNGKLIFNATSPATGNELWISDGTTAGTQMLKDIDPGVAGSTPSGFTILNGNAYFSASDGGGVGQNHELWVTDGTATGTVMVKDIFSDPTRSSSPRDFKLYNSTILFIADDANGTELWKTDGTAAGTVMVKDINPGTASGFQSVTTGQFTLYNGKIYFVADSGGVAAELWVTDGTTAGTTLIKDIRTNGNSFSDIGNFIVFDNKLYFGAKDDGTNRELWVTDGTTASTKIALDICPGTCGSMVNGDPVIVYKKFLYLIAADINFDLQLYRTNGTLPGTIKYAPATKTNAVQITYEFYPYDSSLYFCADYDNGGRELWVLKDTTGSNVVTPPGNVNTINVSDGFKIYPNPNNGYFNLQIDNIDGNNGVATVYDMIGKVITTKIINQKTSFIHLDNCPKGIYFVKLQLNDISIMKQVIIE